MVGNLIVLKERKTNKICSSLFWTTEKLKIERKMTENLTSFLWASKSKSWTPSIFSFSVFCKGS